MFVLEEDHQSRSRSMDGNPTLATFVGVGGRTWTAVGTGEIKEGSLGA